MTNQDKDKSFFGNARQFIMFRIIHVDDSPHRIALGVSLGIFTAFLPFLGLHTLTAFALAFFIRANKVVAVLCSWISNPLTVIPIFVPCYVFGRAVVSIFKHSPVTDLNQVTEILQRLFSLSSLTTVMTSADFWKEMASLFGKIGFELITGCLIVGVTLAVISYFATRKMIIVHRNKVAHSHRKKVR